MDTSEALNWLYSFKKHGSKLGLERISYLVDKLDNPQNKIKTIHITGTNGKGSVCKFIASVLQKAGYNVGVYISPHLQRFSERIVINNNEISNDDMVLLIEKVKPIVEKMISQGNAPTFFEIVTAMSFLFFCESSVDFAVIEVGLGGRFDATNVINPLISIITNISLEHTKFLGDSIESVSYEKAGIIKSNTPIVTAASNSSLKVIKKIAKEKNASLITISDKNWKRVFFNHTHQEFIVHGMLKDYPVKSVQLGMYQGENIACAIFSIEQLQMMGVYITEENIKEGIFSAFNPGRMEIISENPIVILDGAHNPDAMKMLRISLEKDFQFKKLILIIGILEDKNYQEMISHVLPISDITILTKSNNTRACEPKILKETIEKLGFKNHVSIIKKIPEAIKYAKMKAETGDLICISGSLFTVGEARQHLFGINEEIVEC